MRRLLLLTSLLLAGCVTSREAPSNILWGDLISSSYQIADSLLSNLKQQISTNDPIIVATFVNINNLQESSTFGRMVAEHISSRFSQRGYRISELRLRTNSIFMEEGKGEMLLSRDLKSVSQKHNASAVIVGTYGRAGYGFYVSARIVDPSDSVIISSCDYVVKMSDMDQAVLVKN